MSKYDEAKEVAKKLVELEKTRKQSMDEQKALKEELLNLIQENEINSMFEFNDGVVFTEKSTTWKVADGLKEETQVKSKKPEKLSDDFIETYFKPDLKLSKQAKKAIREEDSELLAVLVPEEKLKIKITVSE